QLSRSFAQYLFKPVWQTELEAYMSSNWPRSPRVNLFDFIKYSNKLKVVLNQMHMRDCEIDNKDWSQRYHRLQSVINARQSIARELSELPVKLRISPNNNMIYEPAYLHNIDNELNRVFGAYGRFSTPVKHLEKVEERKNL